MDIWSMGSLWTIAVVVLVNVHLAMDIHRWVFITHIAVWGSIIITYACMVILDSIPVFPNYWLASMTSAVLCSVLKLMNVLLHEVIYNFHIFLWGRTIYHLASSPTYWITILLITVVALLPRFVYKVVHHIFWPSDIQIAREAEILCGQHKHLVSKQDEGSS